MERIFDEIKRTPSYGGALERLKIRRDVSLSGIWGSSAALIVAALAEARSGTFLVVTAGLEEADDLTEDMVSFRPGLCKLFPAWETLPSAEEHPDAAIAGRRVSVLRLLSRRKESGATSPLVIVAPVQALLQAAAPPDVLEANRLSLSVGDEHDPERIAAWLVERGFESSPWVEYPGEFSRRGGILDIFPNDRAEPVRIEFFGDRIESIRPMDVESQRSSEDLTHVEFVALTGSSLREGEQASRSVCLLDYFGDDAVLALLEPVDVQQRARNYVDSLGDPVGTFSWEGVYKQSNRLAKLFMATFAGPDSIDMEISLPEAFPPGLENVAQGLHALLSDVDRAVVFCKNQAEAERLREAIPEEARPLLAKLVTRVGELNRGFKLKSIRTAVVGHHEIFHRYTVRRPPRKLAKGRPIETFLDLRKGDPVVHIEYGIGRYLGTTLLERDGTRQEFLVLEYRDRVKVYVPSTRIHLVQKYVGGFEGKPQLSVIGGTAWEKRKEAVGEAVKQMAGEMLEMQAIRNTQPGIAHPSDDRYQQEFEAEFIYEETEDQLEVIDEIKRDMQTPRPMDRLVCGDVGYGKTELAMRAAFKAAMNGKQVAVLVPTTVLAQQHYTTFRERMADYPVAIEMLSRFRTKAEQARAIAALAQGRVDIVVGTHRLIQNDVRFADLGLVVVDEEQRFGVAHKEHFKTLRTTVDVLTLTATPIPRTLHMSLLGIRDISSLETPPQDRQAIETHVVRFDENLIRTAILRELNRDGQVFFVHNRVHNIRKIANIVSDVVPEARITIGHGQMSERELSGHMARFVRRDADVLVCTTIIESGLDIPNANTIFINNADKFGLADLHQLRGRVGRYKHRAYAYFMIDPRGRVREKAGKRLKAIQDYCELGAGFRIALRDLEIRGAGNILGRQQSGHIASVGYELYCQLLERAIKSLRNEPVEERREASIHVGLIAYLPESYVESEKDRLELYRRFERARDLNELEDVRVELRDRFGELPPSAEGLFVLHRLRQLLQQWEILALAKLKDRLVFTFRDAQKLSTALSAVQSQVRLIDDETAHVVLDRRLAESGEVAGFLLRLLGGPDEPIPAHLRRRPASRKKR